MAVCLFFDKNICLREDPMEEMVEKGEILYYKDENMADLRNYHFKKHWKAKNGEPGRGSDQTRGSYILKVPMGTEVRDDSGDHL